MSMDKVKKLIAHAWCDDDKVHDVPQIPHVRIFVQDESQSKNFGAHLYGEDNHEYRFEVLLQSEK